MAEQTSTTVAGTTLIKTTTRPKTSTSRIILAILAIIAVIGAIFLITFLALDVFYIPYLSEFSKFLVLLLSPFLPLFFPLFLGAEMPVGLTGLVMLNLMEGFDLGALPAGSAERLHLEIEIARLAYAVRNRHVTEEAAMRVPVDELISKSWAETLRARICRDEAMTDLGTLDLKTSDTVYMTVVDRDGNAVSLINSIFDSFGSGILCPETGVLFQNRGHSFSLDPAHPNVLAPGKRAMHTIMPGMVTEGGRPALSFGVMGGDYQPMGQARVISALFDHGMDLQAALDAPRVFTPGDAVEVERSVPADVLRGLARKGHVLRLAPDPIGGAQAIRIDHDRGVLIGASDPRKDGQACGY